MMSHWINQKAFVIKYLWYIHLYATFFEHENEYNKLKGNDFLTLGFFHTWKFFMCFFFNIIYIKRHFEAVWMSTKGCSLYILMVER